MASASICRVGTPLSLAVMGGTFITGGQQGRRGICVPHTEDTMYEQEFLNRHDPSRCLTMDELEEGVHFRGNDNDPEDERTFAQRLLAVEKPTSNQIHAAALVVIANPELLVELYAKGIHPEGIYNHDDRLIARKRIFTLAQNIFTAMLAISSAKKIVRSLANRRDESGKTLLAHLAQFARHEMKKKSRHFTACVILKSLGYDDVFSRYLD